MFERRFPAQFESMTDKVCFELCDFERKYLLLVGQLVRTIDCKHTATCKSRRDHASACLSRSLERFSKAIISFSVQFVQDILGNSMELMVKSLFFSAVVAN